MLKHLTSMIVRITVAVTQFWEKNSVRNSLRGECYWERKLGENKHKDQQEKNPQKSNKIVYLAKILHSMFHFRGSNHFREGTLAVKAAPRPTGLTQTSVILCFALVTVDTNLSTLFYSFTSSSYFWDLEPCDDRYLSVTSWAMST